MTFILFRENFQVQQYNLGIGKGEGKGKGVEVKGMGGEWSCKPANSTHKCRTCVLSNGPPGNRRWLHVWTPSWKISAIRSANRRPPEITEKNFFSKTVSVRIPAQCRRQLLQISVEKVPQSSSLIRKQIKKPLHVFVTVTTSVYGQVKHLLSTVVFSIIPRCNRTVHPLTKSRSLKSQTVLI